MTRFRGLMALGLTLLALAAPARAEVVVPDDDGRPVRLPAAARRIVSLAPHVTELLFAAGAGDRVVATVRYGDYPEAAKALPVVGDAHSLDLERIVALKADLVVVWMHGSAAQQIERLRALKLPIFHSEPRHLVDIGDGLRRLGRLAGTEAAASAAADRYDAELAALRSQYATRPPLRVFYQVWHKPLLTINDHHLIADVVRLCGGVNVFGDQTALVPAISTEAVLAARPQVLATSTLNGTVDDSVELWRPFKSFEPVAKGALVTIPSDHISRHTPRILLGARRMCEGFEQVRAGRPVKLPAIDTGRRPS